LRKTTKALGEKEHKGKKTTEERDQKNDEKKEEGEGKQRDCA